MNRPVAAFFAVLLLILSTAARGEVKVPAIFGDHMVLQRGMKIPIWGTADAGEKVTVKLANQERATTADEHGKWRVTLDPVAANGSLVVTIAGTNTITLHDVLVGEVWLASGQSNMSFELRNAANGTDAVRQADQPTMRLFTVDRTYPNEPQSELTGEWKVCSPETAKDFSAVAYFFGRELQQNLNQPVGLIESDWGGTRAEAWMPRETFESLHLPYEPAWTEQWLNPKPRPGSTQPVVKRPHEAPAVLYNGMIAPVAGYAMRGVIWYQGETNTAYPEQYGDVLSAMIASWRRAWGQGDFPFLIVQLANFNSPGRDWPALRAAQARVARETPNAALAVTIDVGNPRNIHPTDKQTVGHRLALAARKVAYGQDVQASGPTFESLRVAGPKAIVTFDHTAGGLVARSGKLGGFELAGEDGKFRPAAATITGDAVELRADGVTSPHAARYGWANDPRCTLYNRADLPAVPFEARAD
jgi:sialate O-acetylesterase